VTIWCNGQYGPKALALLGEGVGPHRLLLSAKPTGVLAAGGSEPAFFEADIVCGQPDPAECLRHKGLRWIAVNSAGYTRYDNAAFKETMKERGTAFTNASSVYADPCAQHALSMMLACARELIPSHEAQMSDRGWHYTERRARSVLLTGQTVVFLGFGAIGRRLAELLAPFQMRIYALRRQTRSEAGVRIFPEADITKVFPLADHVVNLLPENEETRTYVNRRRLALLKPTARFYNVGRGTTVDQAALIEALETARLASAYLDVTEPEPLPPTHPLWSTRNCFITPHTAGGEADQDQILVRHFLANLACFAEGRELRDRIF
jgi:phosphoglycerate dehydrogenase-like enzyme